MPGIANPIVSTAEVQTVTVDATGGTFTVTWNGATTSALAFDVSAATFTTAMDAVADGAGNVVVTGGPGAAGGGTPYTLTWSAGRGNVPAPTTDATSLTGGAGTAVVATTAAGVSALADPWLSVGAHAEPTTSVVPDRGDWQWCMMEVAAWMAGEAWSDDPANVSPVIAQLCKLLNDTLPDSTRQELKVFLVAAPDGVIDTVDAGKETTRRNMCTDWLVRTLRIPFREAHHVTGRAVRLAEERGVPLHRLPLADLQAIHGGISADVFSVLTVENSVKSRRSYGGTAPSVVRRQVRAWRKRLARR